MKTFNFARRFAALMIATVMMLGTAVSASAAETVPSNVGSEDIIAQPNVMLATDDEESWFVSGVGSGVTITGTVTLKPYIGLSKTINAVILPLDNGGTVTGKVHIIIRRSSDNETVATYSIDPNGDWVKSTKLTLPKSGEYKILAYNDMNTSTYIHVYWS